MIDAVISEAANPIVNADYLNQPKRFKFVVTHPDDPNRVMLKTNYDYEILYTSENMRKKYGEVAPEHCTVEHFNECRIRQGLIQVGTARYKNIRESGWKPKSQIVVKKWPGSETKVKG